MVILELLSVPLTWETEVFAYLLVTDFTSTTFSLVSPTLRFSL